MHKKNSTKFEICESTYSEAIISRNNSKYEGFHFRGSELRKCDPVHIFSSDVSKSVSRLTDTEVVVNYRIISEFRLFRMRIWKITRHVTVPCDQPNARLLTMKNITNDYTLTIRYSHKRIGSCWQIHRVERRSKLSETISNEHIN